MSFWKMVKGHRNSLSKFTFGAVAALSMGLGGAAGAAAGDPAAFAKLIEAAKKEGTVVVDGPPIDAVRSSITEKFEKKYGIKVSYISSGTSKSGARVRAERAAERYLLDVFISGADTPLLTFRASGWLDPIAPVLFDPDVTDPSKWRGNHLWFVDPDKKVLRLLQYATPNLAINTKLVKEGEVTKWGDLLNEKWRGKIVAKDPATAGSGASLIGYFYLKFGPEFVRKLYKEQQPFISRDRRQPVRWLAEGKYPIIVGPDQKELKKFTDLGYPVKPVFPTDGPGILSGGWGMLCLMNKAPHPNAAKLFVNWLASQEGLEAYAKATSSVGLRKDISNDWAPAYLVPEEGKEYLDTYEYDFVVENREEAFKKVKALLGL